MISAAGALTGGNLLPCNPPVWAPAALFTAHDNTETYTKRRSK